MLSEQDRERIQKRLLEERERALAALADFDESADSSLLEKSGELSVIRFHPADLGTESINQEQEFLLASQEGRRLYRIDEALRRLYREPETFGTCQRCGREIPLERLEVVPESPFCAEDQEATEG